MYSSSHIVVVALYTGWDDVEINSADMNDIVSVNAFR